MTDKCIIHIYDGENSPDGPRVFCGDDSYPDCVVQELQWLLNSMRFGFPSRDKQRTEHCQACLDAIPPLTLLRAVQL